MSQNRSHAVMAQRHEPHDSLDDFPTPPWATRALIHKVLAACDWRMDQLAEMSCREPACNRGYMAKPLREYFGGVEASDVHDYGFGENGFGTVSDFLFPAPLEPVDFTITNPPFKLAEQFVKRALETSRIGVAMFVRCSFYEGQQRYEQLFSRYKPTFYAPFAERVVLTKGRLLNPDKFYPWKNPKTGEIEMKKPSTATAYAWFVWETGSATLALGATEVCLIPPCRKQLTIAGDYPDDEGQIDVDSQIAQNETGVEA